MSPLSCLRPLVSSPRCHLSSIDGDQDAVSLSGKQLAPSQGVCLPHLGHLGEPWSRGLQPGPSSSSLTSSGQVTTEVLQTEFALPSLPPAEVPLSLFGRLVCRRGHSC